MNYNELLLQSIFKSIATCRFCKLKAGLSLLYFSSFPPGADQVNTYAGYNTGYHGSRYFSIHFAGFIR